MKSGHWLRELHEELSYCDAANWSVTMGNRNVLHVCQHCGIVHATSSSTAPEACFVCEAFTFSLYGPAEPVERAETSRVRERISVRA